MPSPLLTIAIPTYNRAKELDERLTEIAVQRRPELGVVVFNDGSTDNTATVLREWEARGVEWHDAPVNEGLSRNLLRCWEEARGEWIWVLGDDDSLQADSVERALALIARFPEAMVINFESSACANPEERSFASVGEFLAKKDATELGFISSLLWRSAAIRPDLKAAAQGTMTIAPHIPLIFRALDNKRGPVVCVKGELLNERTGDFRWSSLELAFGLALIPMFIRDAGDSVTCAAGLWNNTRWMFVMGLREADSPAAFRRWHRMRRQTNALLRAQGASFWRRTVRSPQRRHLRSEMLSLLFACLPWTLTRLILRKFDFRRRWDGDKVLLDNH